MQSGRMCETKRLPIGGTLAIERNNNTLGLMLAVTLTRDERKSRQFLIDQRFDCRPSNSRRNSLLGDITTVDDSSVKVVR